MGDRVIWAQNLEQVGIAECLAETILQAVAAHPEAIMDVEANTVLGISCVAVISSHEDPEDPMFWRVGLFDEPKSVGDEV